MTRSNESANSVLPALPDQQGWRHWGDGLAGKIVAARLQGFYPTAADYRDVQVDANGAVQTGGSAPGGGGIVTQGARDATVQNWYSELRTALGASYDARDRNWTITEPVTVTGGLTDTQLRASAVPVSLASVPSHAVTQGTSPWVVSGADTTLGATVTPKAASVWDVADRAARLVGHVTVDNASIPVTGTFFQATQPVSGTVSATQGTAAAASAAWPTKVTDGTNVGAVKAASVFAAATDPAQVVAQSPMRADASTLAVTVTAATGVAATLTLPSAGAGLFHYISLIELDLYATAARTGGATPVLVTTTNLPGSPVWDFDTGQAIGATIRKTVQPATPIKSSVAATATTIVAPIATTGIWRITAYYYAAP